MNNTLSPIVLFVYNRPSHTLQTLRALQANKLADRSLLIVYADGPKPDATLSDRAKIEQTRSVVAQEEWCGRTHIVTSSHNKGLANSIVDGVQEVIKHHKKVIVLEDDIITSSGFLTYMNDALECYKSEEKVMHVSGFFLPVRKPNRLPETFFYNQASCWGWATWDRAWKFFDTDSERLLLEVEKNWQNLYFQYRRLVSFFGTIKS